MERTFKLIELVGVSDASFDDATRNAVAKAARTLKGLSWFEVTEMRGLIHAGNITEYQVTLKVAFRLLDTEAGEVAEPAASLGRRMRAVRRRTRAA